MKEKLKIIFSRNLLILIFSLILVVSLYFSATKVGHEIFVIVLGLLLLDATFELLKCVGLSRRFSIVMVSLLYPVTVFILIHVYNDMDWVPQILLATIIYIIIMLILSMLSNGIVRIGQITQVIIITIYFVLSLLTIITLRYNYGIYGNYLYVSVFIVAITTHMMFTLGNKKMGKHKIFPRVNLDFSFEGVLAALIISLVVELLHGMLLNIRFHIRINWIPFILIIIISSLFSIIGKMIFAYMKKENDVSFFALTGNEKYGLLEVYDGVLFLFPLLYFIYFIFEPVIFIPSI